MTAPAPSAAEAAVIDRFGIFDEERAQVPAYPFDQPMDPDEWCELPPVTAVDVAALDAARAAAKPGRWTSEGRAVFHNGASFMAPWKTDAALIVAAVNALPDLLAEVRRGRALRVRIERSVEAAEISLAHGLPVDIAEYVAGLRAVIAAVDGTP